MGPLPQRPTESPAPPAGAGKRSGFLTLVSLVALLAAMTATVLAIYAIGLANTANATRATYASAPAVAPGVGVPSLPTATNAASQPAAPKASPGVLNPTAVFTEAYNPMPQRLEVHLSGDRRLIDLDRPQIDAGGPDVFLSSDQRLSFNSGVNVATAKAADVQPKDCVELIRTAVLSADITIPVGTPDLTLCIVTSLAAANGAGISRKLVVLHVTGVATDGTVQLDLKAWNIPD